MPFILIQGTFHLVGQTQAGNPTGFEPDGDSIQFKPANPQLLDRLTSSPGPTGSPRSGQPSCALKASTPSSSTSTAPTSHGHWPTRHATSSPASFT
jgi:hypothetical protein